MHKKTWDDFGKRDRAAYLQATKALYGQEEGTPVITPRKPKVKRKRNQYERTIQCQIVYWAKTLGLLMHSIPNHGKRTVWAGEREKAMGLLAGVSDLFLAEPNKNHHGFYIEVKSPGKKPTELQYRFGQEVILRGYNWRWFDDFDLAKLAIENYLANK